MKNFIFSAISLVFLMQLFTACDKTPVDLMTGDAKTGGILSPNLSIAYLLGATPIVDVALEVPKGPAITSIKVYNRYLRRSDTTYSNQVLLKTIDVGSANVDESLTKDYTLTYADLSKDITVDGEPLPTDENLLPIGDTWELLYISEMADGRSVENSALTKIDVSNRWAASYLMSGYALREGDPVLTGYFSDIPWKLATNSAKSVIFTKIQVWGDGTSTVGGIGPWVLTMDDSAGPDAPMPVTVTDAANPAVKNNPDYSSRYEPSTKTFYISVYWGSGPTNRAAVDTLVYSGPY
jgi:hypothetical protein